ncbi:MAG: glycosyltransferase family 2 protein [bacterium]
MKIALVIPAYNEAGTIAALASEALIHCPWVIVVDDGSTDGTTETLEGMPVTVLRNENNMGKGASITRGQRHAISQGADAVITMDADGQHRPEDLPRFIAAIGDHPGSLILGVRTRGSSSAPTLRLFANRFADFWISWAAGLPIKDTQSGFRLYPADLLRQVRIKSRRAGSFVFESAVLIEAGRKGWGVHELPIDSIYHTGRRASYYRPVIDTTRIVIMVTWKLVSWLGYPRGLLRSRGLLKLPASKEHHGNPEKTRAPRKPA